MIISADTINLYLKNRLSIDQIIASFESTEVEIEQIMYSNRIDTKVLVGKVLDLTPHPDADRLKVATVDIGSVRPLTIVCGAPNIEVGQLVPVATVGAILRDGLKIKKSKIRGYESEGMICSSAELGISDDHSGIMVLNHPAQVGQTLCDIINLPTRLDIKTQPSRWDHLSIVGLSRDICAYGPENQLIMPEKAKIAYQNEEIVKVKETGKCKRFISARLKINNVVKSPTWLVDNLESNGIRSINTIVDITNFVMLETGQPSHAYDAKKVEGNLTVRHASPSEKLEFIDGKIRELTSEDLIIADDKNPVGLVGVMGGSNSEVDEKTEEIILEVANFDKTIVRRAALRHGLRTEASARFERSLPLPLQTFAFERLVYLLQEICQAEIIDGPFDQCYGWPWIQHIGFRVRRAERILGVSLDERKFSTQLKSLGFEVEHFSFTKEARKHLGRPYKWGANFKQDGTSAFDCSYLIDYIYSLIGVYIGHTALAQYEHGESVDVAELRPGDVVFYEGLIEKSAVDHYFIRDEKGQHHKRQLSKHKRVGHNGIYIGNNKVVTAAEYEYKSGKWLKRAQGGVIEVPLSEFVNNPGYLGARRYIASSNHILAVTAPWWRADITREEDLIEEAAKLIGYDNIPASLPNLPPTHTASHSLLPKLAELKTLLRSRGLFEVMTYSFISAKAAKMNMDAPADLLQIENPKSPEQQYLRRNMFASIMHALQTNQHYQDEIAIYEVSKVYRQSEPDVLPDQPWVLAATVKGSLSLAKVKGVIDSIVSWLGLEIDFHNEAGLEYLVEGRSTQIFFHNQMIGFFGQIKPSLLLDNDIHGEVSFAQIDVEPLMVAKHHRELREIPIYQYIERDISHTFDRAISWQQIKQIVCKSSSSVVKVQYLSDFQDDKLDAEDRKNIAWRVWLDLGANPSQHDIAKSLDTIVGKVEKLNKKV